MNFFQRDKYQGISYPFNIKRGYRQHKCISVTYDSDKDETYNDATKREYIEYTLETMLRLPRVKIKLKGDFKDICEKVAILDVQNDSHHYEFNDPNEPKLVSDWVEEIDKQGTTDLAIILVKNPNREVPYSPNMPVIYYNKNDSVKVSLPDKKNYRNN